METLMHSLWILMSLYGAIAGARTGGLLSCQPHTDQSYLKALYMEELTTKCTDSSLYGVLPFAQLATMKHSLQPALHQCNHISHPETGVCDWEKQTNCVDCQLLFDVINENNRIPCPGMSWKPNDEAATNQQSHCPWHYRVTTSKTRYPFKLGEAVCTCDTCRIGDGNDKTMQCVPITHNIPILTAIDKLSDDGVHCVYEMKIIPIATGCTCAAIRSNLKD